MQRKRWLNYGRDKDSPSTHEKAFRDAYKRQYRAISARAEIEAGTSEHLEAYADRFGEDAAAKLAAKNYAIKGEAIAEAIAYGDADAETLAYELMDVVEINTISGPRLVWADRVHEYDNHLEES